MNILKRLFSRLVKSKVSTEEKFSIAAATTTTGVLKGTFYEATAVCEQHDRSMNCEVCSRDGATGNTPHVWIGRRCMKCGKIRDENQYSNSKKIKIINEKRLQKKHMIGEGQTMHNTGGIFILPGNVMLSKAVFTELYEVAKKNKTKIIICRTPRFVDIYDLLEEAHRKSSDDFGFKIRCFVNGPVGLRMPYPFYFEERDIVPEGCVEQKIGDAVLHVPQNYSFFSGNSWVFRLVCKLPNKTGRWSTVDYVEHVEEHPCYVWLELKSSIDISGDGQTTEQALKKYLIYGDPIEKVKEIARWYQTQINIVAEGWLSTKPRSFDEFQDRQRTDRFLKYLETKR